MTAKRVYLDYNATTPLLREAAEAAVLAWSWPCNPSSVHGYGRDARKLLDNARATVAKALGAEGAQIIFTASGTEANNLAIRGFAQNVNNIMVSATEHLSVLNPATKQGALFIPVDNNGIVQRAALEHLLESTEGRTLVSLQLANNETGVIQHVKELARVVLRYGFIHCDASQAIGKIPVNFNDLNVDMMTISGHKFGGPAGAAALIVKKGLHIQPQKLGGGQEQGYRAGTENVAAIAGMARALEVMTLQDQATQPQEKGRKAVQQVRGENTRELRDYLETQMSSIASNVVIFGRNVSRLPNTTCFALTGMGSETQLINFDLAGVAVSSGSACSSGKVSLSHVLQAMNVNKKLAGSAIRVSLGHETTKKDVEAFLEVFKKNYEKTTCNVEAA